MRSCRSFESRRVFLLWAAVATCLFPMGGVQAASRKHHDLLSRGDYACLHAGREDWPNLHRKLLRFLERQISVEALRTALSRAMDSEPNLDDEGDASDCVIGQSSLRTLLLVVSGEAVAPDDVAQILKADWETIKKVGLISTIRSGWPVFRLLRTLHMRVADGLPKERRESHQVCGDVTSEGDVNYITLLEQYVVHRGVPPWDTLIAASMEYLAGSWEKCPLTVASAFLAVAWSRFPVYDHDTETLIEKAQSYIFSVDLSLLFSTSHPFLRVLDDVASTYQAFLIDSGALYSDTAPRDKDSPPVVDYTRHMMDDASFRSGSAGECVVSFAKTPKGHCNVFAPISRSLSYWRKKGVEFEDTLFAFRQITDQKNILFRIRGEELYMITPRHSHFSADFAGSEPICLAHTILTVLAKANLPDMDFVLNHGDLPLLRGMSNRPPFYGPDDRDARFPAPLFSICASEDFWDIPFPNTCRPSLTNISNLSRTPWKEKKNAAFWRGTDRGAVNWAIELKDMWRGSPRKQFVDKWGSDDLFDLAFLEDDLLNSSVVNTDSNFVPLDKWLDWKYLIDLPGNGYSGSLKQKLTGSSAVLLLTDIDRPGAVPVYEHYHAGLQHGVHVLQISMKEADSTVKWAIEHDKLAEDIARNANEYMSHYEELWQCYVWRLLTMYSDLLRYTPTDDQLPAFGDINIQAVSIHRRPSQAENEAFVDRCMKLIDEHSQ
eukprot:TRINITY_DN100545_c0_g1_i1.p1 TRINITY_DN100545_c0_g1~~TRINITY_DN100545_c0_g1_i1.p1  ORF type:complete len:718 (-),score=53.06 TRINITY_DN100545_c0_g1_i1:89-2242(-)